MSSVLTLERSKKKKGFTLIELIIVMAIIAILAAIAVPRFLNVRRDANLRADIANGKTINNAVTALLAQNQLTLAATGETTIDLSPTAPASPTANYTAVQDYLQNIPAPRTETGNDFIVHISDHQVVTITVNGHQVSPAAAWDYANVD